MAALLPELVALQPDLLLQLVTMVNPIDLVAKVSAERLISEQLTHNTRGCAACFVSESDDRLCT